MMYWLRRGIFFMVSYGMMLATQSCNPEGGSLSSPPNYLPLRVGNYWIYHVNETQITLSVEVDFEYDLQAQITDSIPNAIGGFSYVLSRSKRNEATEPWQPFDTWLIRSDEKEVVMTEGTVPFVRITFPIKNNKTWNGNAYNNIETGKFCTINGALVECDQYTFADVGQPFGTSSSLFENTITIIQSNDPDLITRYDIRKEIYAAGIGLIKKESVVYDYCTQPTCFGNQEIETGLRFMQELTDYGHE